MLVEHGGGRVDEETPMKSSAGGEEGDGGADRQRRCTNRGDAEVAGAEGFADVRSPELGSRHVVVVLKVSRSVGFQKKKQTEKKEGTERRRKRAAGEEGRGGKRNPRVRVRRGNRGGR